jgi:Dyp-type peroxidase family
MAERRNQSIVEWLDINLDNLSIDERKNLTREILETLPGTDLREIRDITEQLRQEKIEDTKARLLNDFRASVEAEGLSLEDFSSAFVRRGKGSALPPKYRSPEGDTLQEQLKQLLAEPLQDVDLQREPLQTVLHNVQGNILHGHGRNFAAHVFLEFRPGKQAEIKQWLRDYIVPRIMSAQQQLAERQAKKRDALFVSCLVSARGYSFLWGPDTNERFRAEFRGGMKKAKDRLHDLSYLLWEENYQKENEIHAMILLAHQDDTILRAQQQQLVEGHIKPLAERHWVEWGNVLHKNGLADGPREEHFGYVDGHSQPLFFQHDLEKETQERGMDQWDPGVGPSLVLTPDPLGEVMDYGSYFVFRKLQQDVEGFKAQIKTLAAELGVDQEQAKALVMGRFPDGKPLAFHDTSRVYPNPDNAVPNDFRYDRDLDGQLCPYHAHIRRMNPRRDAGGLRYDRRIVRRGIPYGKKDEQPVGLLFMCYQQNLATQFEALQGRWAYKPDNSTSSQSGNDPLIGVMVGVKADPQQWPRPGGATGETVRVPIGGFVTLRGGEYFFAPSINVLTKALLR